MDQKFLLDSRKSSSTMNPYATAMLRYLLHLSLRLVLSWSFYYGVFMWVKTNQPPHMVARINARCGSEGILPKICWVSAKIFVWNLFVSWEIWRWKHLKHLVFIASWVTLETKLRTHGSREWYWRVMGLFNSLISQSSKWVYCTFSSFEVW